MTSWPRCCCCATFRSCVVAFSQVKLEEIEMIPKSGKSPADSRKSVGIHEFAALARSSLNGNKHIWLNSNSSGDSEASSLTLSLWVTGISQAVRDHVTKPTSLAQGRVAHLIEWKGWPKPSDPPSNAHAHFSSYCHLTEGEKEARFAAGVHLPPVQHFLSDPRGSAGPPCSGHLSHSGIPAWFSPCRWSAAPAGLAWAADGGLLDLLREASRHLK